MEMGVIWTLLVFLDFSFPWLGYSKVANFFQKKKKRDEALPTPHNFLLRWSKLLLA